MTQNKCSPQQGRSMVEMLGVLAIIGILSITGIAAYTYAMNKHRANEIVDTILRKLPDISASMLTGVNPEHYETKVSNATIAVTAWNNREDWPEADDGQFSFVVENISPIVCRNVKELLEDKAVDVLVACDEKEGNNNFIQFTFNDNLSTDENYGGGTYRAPEAPEEGGGEDGGNPEDGGGEDGGDPEDGSGEDGGDPEDGGGENGGGNLGNVITKICPQNATCRSNGTFVCDAGYEVTTDKEGCKACPPGKFSRGSGNKCEPCTKGYYCPQSGTTYSSRQKCPTGHYCKAGSKEGEVCSAGTYANNDGTECLACTAGCYCTEGVKRECKTGYYCPAGAKEQTVCPDGSYSSVRATSCTPCQAGYYCKQGVEHGCERGTYSTGGAATCTPCPDGTTTLSGKASSPDDCSYEDE